MEYLPGNPPSVLEALWRGGFPESALAGGAPRQPARWRESYVRSLVERDLPMLGTRTPSIALERLLSMCAHLQGQLLNAAKLGASLDVTGPAIRSRLDFLQEAFLVRLLPAWSGNLKKRLITSPKLYIRDTGLCHALLDIQSTDDLLGHPGFGASWEAFCLEALCSSLSDWRPSFYRSSGGAELDLILERGSHRIAFEFKASGAPTPTKGFHIAKEDLEPERSFIVGLLEGSYAIARDITVCGIREGIEFVSKTDNL